MRNTTELAAEFIRRAAFVDAHALLKDEYGVEYKEPSQVQYYALFKDHEDSKAINEALKHAADMLGCMTHIEYQETSSRLTIVGEKTAVDTIRQVWRTALKTYETTLNERPPIKSRKEWADDYILGFFEGLTARHSHASPRILGLLDGMKKGEQ